MSYSAYMSATKGYDLSLFETSGTAAKKPEPKKVKKRQPANRIVEIPEFTVEAGQRRKHNFAALAFGFVFAAIVAIVVGVMIHGQVQLAELNQEIAAKGKELEESRSAYIQLEAQQKTSLSTTTVEKIARTELGMSKATSQQKQYISLADSDKAEIFAEDEGTVFNEAGEYIDSMVS